MRDMYHHLKMEMLSPLFPPPPDLDDRWPTTDDDSFTNPGESNHLFSPAGLTSPPLEATTVPEPCADRRYPSDSSWA